MKTRFYACLLLSALLLTALSACSAVGAQVNLLQAPTETATSVIATETRAATSTPVATIPPVKTALPTPTPAALPGTGIQQQDVLNFFQGSLETVYKQVNPSVVTIMNEGELTRQGISGSPDSSPSFVPQGLGSGFLWDNQGHIVTNNHVIEGAARLEVTFSDGATVSATVVGADPGSDLAVIQAEQVPSGLAGIPLANSDQLQVGQVAIAIGNPFGLQGTMTMGIISALGRSMPAGAALTNFVIPDVIQTDASINPGNSGGPLVNINGQLIGVNTSIASTVDSSAGVGFAIPSNTVQLVVPSLIQTGKYEHPYLGIQGGTLVADIAKAMGVDPQTGGVLVVAVTPGSPAEKAGLKGSQKTTQVNGQEVPAGGDIITGIDGQQIKSMNELISYLSDHTKVGDQVTLQVLRGGQKQSVNVTIGARPAEQQTGPAVTPQSGVQLGVGVTNLTANLAGTLNLPADTQGVVVTSVVPGSPAEQAGLRPDDVITAVDGQAVTSVQELRSSLQQAGPGAQVQLTLIRSGHQQQVTVTLAAQAP